MKKIFLIPTSLLITASVAFASSSYTPPTIDIKPVMATLGAVATALAGIWAVKKVVKLLNKS